MAVNIQIASSATLAFTQRGPRRLLRVNVEKRMIQRESFGWSTWKIPCEFMFVFRFLIFSSRDALAHLLFFSISVLAMLWQDLSITDSLLKDTERFVVPLSTRIPTLDQWQLLQPYSKTTLFTDIKVSHAAFHFSFICMREVLSD